MTRRPDHGAGPPGEVPFSRPLAVDEVREDGLDMDIEANIAECDAVAKDIGLPSVESLMAKFRIARRPGGHLYVEGEVSARITQICVVSLQPFDSMVSQPVEIEFAPPPPNAADRDLRARHIPALSRRRRDEPPPSPPPSVDVGEADAPDPIVDGKIDLGAVAVEFLTLGLDFYPRKPGVHFTDTACGAADAPQATAFAVLERLKDRS